MNKYLSKIVGVVASLAMVIGVGVGIASNKKAAQLQATYSGSSPYSISLVSGTGGASGTVRWEEGSSSLSNSPSDGVSWTPSVTWADANATSWQNSNSHVQIGANGKAASEVTLTTSDIPGTIYSVDVMCASYQGKHTVNVSVGGNAYTMDDSTTPTWSSSVDTSRTGTGSSSGAIVVSFASTTGARALYIKSISVTYSAGGQLNYTVTYNAHGGTGSMSDTNSPYASGSTVTVLDNEFTYAHHTFDHWNTAEDGSGTSYDPADTFTISANTTLYAQWTEIPTYTVTYHDTNATSGNAPTDNNRYEEGDSVTVKGNNGTLVRTGYDWYGWSLNENDSETAYGPAFTDTYTMGTSNIDFYPIWVVQPSIPSYDEELAFHFEGSTVHGSSTSYSNRSASVASADTSEYENATWQITVGNNSASLGTNAKEGNLPLATLGNGNYAAAAGLASAIGIETTTQKYSAAICTTPMSFVHKVELVYTGTNGGAPTSAWVLSSTNGTTWEIEARKVWNIITGSVFSFVRNDDSRQYAFVAFWNTDYSGGLKGFELKLYGDYPEEQTITASEDSAFSDETITLTTNATSASWSITANTAGATLSTASGKSTVVSATQPGSVTVQASASEYTTVSKTITFTEKPAGVFYNVTFDSDGGTENPDDLIVLENATFDFPSAGTKEHYSFGGWTADTENFYDEGDTSPAITADTEFIAWWIEDAKYVVNYTAGSNGSGSYEHANNYGGSYTLLAFDELTSLSANSGYRFLDYTVAGVHRKPGDVITLSAAVDIIVNFEEIPDIDTLTATKIGVTSYTDWSNVKGDNSCAIYAGNSTKSSKGAVQLRASTGTQALSGIVSTTSGGTIKAVKITWGSETTTSRTINIYGSNTPLQSVEDIYGETPVATLVGTLVWPESASEQTYLFETSYKYVGIRSNFGALYLDSIVFEWNSPVAKETIENTVNTRTALTYNYDFDGADNYTYYDVVLKFGGLITKTLWGELKNESGILRYGLLISTPDYLNGDSLKDAEVDGVNVKDYHTEITAEHLTPAESGDYYIWNLCLRLNESQLTNEYTAIAYIDTVDHGRVYFGETTKSAQSVAYDLIDSGRYDDDDFDGSLLNLATM